MSQFFSFFAAGLCHSNQVVTWKKEAPRLFFPKLQDSFSSSRICRVSHLFFVRLDFEFLKSNFTSGQGVFFPLLQDLHCFKAPGSAQFHILRSCLTSFMRVGQAEVKKKMLKEEKKRNRLWWEKFYSTRLL